MSFRSRMAKKKNGLKARHNQAPKTSGRYPTVFLKAKIPTGIDFFRCSEGQHIVDILPWEAGPDMPLDEQNVPVTEEGDFDYVLDLFVHQNVGSVNQPYVCPYENFGLPCPICEYVKANRLPKKEWSKIRAKRRSIYLVWDRTNPEEEKKGVQIFDAAHFFMEEKIDEIARLPRGGGYIPFSDPDEGKSICWSRKGTGQENTAYLGHRFIDRESAIPDRILDKTFALDQVITMHTDYDEIKNAFNSTLKNETPTEDEPFEDSEEEQEVPEEKSKPKTTKSATKPAVKKKVVVKRKIRTRKK